MAAPRIQPDTNRLKVAHNALNKVKRVYKVEDFKETEHGIHVEYYDQFENWFEVYVSRAELELVFIPNHYSSVTDSVLGGEHHQYEDCRSAADYLDDNLRDVLVDYLNAKRA